MVSFDNWYSEIADMPTLQNGEWIDLETGIPFSRYSNAIENSEKQPKARTKVSDKTQADRNAAKFFGGKPLRGTAKQKSWAEKIRMQIIKSGQLNDEQITNLVTCGGFTEHAKFWIENRDICPSKFTAENIVSQYRALAELEQKHYDFIARTNPAHEKESRREEIRKYIASCDFKFHSDLV